MTTENNKLTMQRFTAFINSASEELGAELISPNALFHVPGRSEPMRGPTGYLAIIGMMRGGFPDIQWTLEELIAEGDKVAARFTMRGTHLGAFFGVPSTGKKSNTAADTNTGRGYINSSKPGWSKPFEIIPSKSCSGSLSGSLKMRLYTRMGSVVM